MNAFPRIISLVPSWTETLLSLGAQVVGRTRYCIHPKNEIAVVGGTKNVNWEAVSALKPDIVILDKEENTKEMADSCPVPWIATHVQSIEDLPSSLEMLSQACQLEVSEYRKRWERVLGSDYSRTRESKVPGILEKLQGELLSSLPPLIYVIWRKPWMAVGEGCFIWSVMKKLGLPCVAPGPGKYPEFDLNREEEEGRLICLSSEPYPFREKKRSLNFRPSSSVVILDGELYSWFGLRSLEFLERELLPD